MTDDVRSDSLRCHAATATAPVRRVIELCKSGQTFSNLISSLVKEFKVTEQKAEKLCHELCDLTILISELQHPITLENPTAYIQSILQASSSKKELAQKLLTVLNSVQSWDADGIRTLDSYEKMVQEICAIFTSQSKDVVQVDTAIDLEGRQISHLVAQQMSRAAEILLRVSQKEAVDFLRDYRKTFAYRYPTGREVPLLELLNPILGLGSPYVTTAKHSTSHSRDRFLLNLAARALRDRTSSVELTDIDLEKLGPPLQTEDCPASLDIFALISAESRADIDSGNFKLLVGPRIGVIGAGRSFGRFSYLLGTPAIKMLSEIADLDQRAANDGICADINYRPNSPRSANVAMTPMIHSYSISAGCTKPDNSTEIPLSEIIIGMENDRFYAKWDRTGERIYTRPNHLLTQRDSPDPVRFLVDVSQEKTQYSLSTFDWGTAEDLPFLPRLSVGNIVLRSAQWRLNSLIQPETLKLDDDAFSARIGEWQVEWNVPNLVHLSTGGDNLLYLNLACKEDIVMLHKMLKKENATSQIISEYIPCEKWHSTKSGHYVTELVASFARTDLQSSRKQSSSNKPNKTEPVPVAEFLRPPGSEWLYVKLTSAPATQEEIIGEAALLAQKLMDVGCITDWFFVRYADPINHLRIRFRVKTEQFYLSALPQVIAWVSEVLARGLCSTTSIETYDREIERYGGIRAMSIAEQIFGIDSTSVVRLLEICKQNELNKELVAVASVNALLSGLGLSQTDSLELLKARMSPGDKRSVSATYRQQRKLLQALLSLEVPGNTSYSAVLDCLQTMRGGLFKCGQELQGLLRNGELKRPIANIISSLIHMHCNRFLDIDPNAERRVRALLASVLETSVKLKELAAA